MSTQAEVLVYKGRVHVAADAETTSAPPRPYFQVIDPVQSLVTSVFGIELGNQKILIASPPVSCRFASSPLRSGKTATTISTASSVGAGNDFFENLMIHFRGTNTLLKTSSTLGGTSKSFPRLFNGIALDDEAHAGKGSFLEQKVIISFQEDRTITANDAGQTIQQATDALVEELKSKGFEVQN